MSPFPESSTKRLKTGTGIGQFQSRSKNAGHNSSTSSAKNGSTADPWDREQFFRRVRTYLPSKWFAKPAEISPLVCARYGWRNSARDQLMCDQCSSCLSFGNYGFSFEDGFHSVLESFLESLTTSHDAFCAWRSVQCPIEFELVNAKQLAGEIVGRIDRLDRVWDLPEIQKQNFDGSVKEHDAAQEKLGRVFDWNLKRIKRKYTMKDGSGGGGKVGGELAENRQAEDTAENPEDDFIDPEIWSNRNETLIILALLGWDVKHVAKKIYVESAVSENQGDNVSATRKRPWPVVKYGSENRTKDDRDYRLARESILFCEHCATEVGLWDFKTLPGIALPKFQRLSAKLAARVKSVLKSDKPVVTTPKPEPVVKKKDVKKTLVGTIAGGEGNAQETQFGFSVPTFGSRKGSFLGGASGSTAKPSLFDSLLGLNKTDDRSSGLLGSNLAKSSDAKTSDGGAGAFGLGKYKRRASMGIGVEKELMEKSVSDVVVVHEVTDDGGDEISIEDYADTVKEGDVLDPFCLHRAFCPFRSQWVKVLEALVE